MKTDMEGKPVKRRRLTPRQRRELWEAAGRRCRYCGKPVSLGEMQVDHIHSVFTLGTDSPENLGCSCRSCNFYKSANTVEVFREEVGKVVGRLLERSFIFRLAVDYGLVEITGRPVEFQFERDVKKKAQP